MRTRAEGGHNWLVLEIVAAAIGKALEEYASGILLDIGCGEKPYRQLADDCVTAHIGLDHPGTRHSQLEIDVYGSAIEVPLLDESVDTVLMTAVLEHLEQPLESVIEVSRILKPGGHLILTAPLFWHLHEQPRDFFRYTSYGLEHLFVTAGLEIVELNPLSGFVVTFIQEFIYFLRSRLNRGIRLVARIVQRPLQQIACILNRWDNSTNFTWAYLVVARRPIVEDKSVPKQ